MSKFPSNAKSLSEMTIFELLVFIIVLIALPFIMLVPICFWMLLKIAQFVVNILYACVLFVQYCAQYLLQAFVKTK